MPPLRYLLAPLRTADWLDGRRARAWATILLAVCTVAAVIWLVTARDFIDRTGRPIGTDFLSFYAAAQLALAGTPALAWDQAAHAAAEAAVFGRNLGYWAFFYPPPFLLLVAPLGLFPYGIALALWVCATTGAAIALLRRYAPTLPLVASLAAPPLWLNLGHGQNGALTLALLCAGFTTADRRPVGAGAVLGSLIIKPQLTPVLPILALAGRRIGLVIGAVIAVALLCLCSIAVFGLDAARAFLTTAAFARLTLEDNAVGAHKMVSIFAGIRLAGGPVALAYTAQALIAGLVLIAVARCVWRQCPDGPALGALAGAATPLVSPFLLDYDLTILLLPLAWLLAHGARDGFRPFEKLLLLAAYLLPFFSRALASTTFVAPAPFLVTAVLALVLARLNRPV